MHKFNNLLTIPYNMDLKEEFLRVYSNLPLNERDKVVLVLQGEPISWNVAYQQVKNSTSRSQEILKALKKLGIL